MNTLTLTDFNGVETVDSRQVAEAVGKEHYNLLKDIAKYCEYLGAVNFDCSDFFIESTYISEQNKQLPCYLCTRKGCEMIANKLTGQKGIAFTALYINAFHEMQEHIKEIEPTPVQPVDKLAERRLELAEKEIRLRMSEQYLKLMAIPNISDTYKNILLAKSAETLAGEQVLPLPKTERKTYSAGEVGEILGISAQKVGKLANQHNLKTEEYGAWYHDKAKYCSKEVDTFRYYDEGIEKLKSLLG